MQESCLGLLEVLFRHLCGRTEEKHQKLKEFVEYNQQDVTFLSLFISVRRCTCFGPVFRLSSGAENCTYSVRYLSDQYLMLYVQFSAPDDEKS